MRFNAQHVQQWHEDGFVIIDDFFSADEVTPVLQDFEVLYKEAGQDLASNPAAGCAKVLQEGDDVAVNRALQFKNIDTLPYQGSSAVNLISLHPQLIALAKALLGVSDVRLYQSHTWAKYTGQADYNQEFHCDFGNHTLTVPSEDAAQRSVDFVFYLTDVTSDQGALRYVTKPDVEAVLGRQRLSASTPRAAGGVNEP